MHSHALARRTRLIGLLLAVGLLAAPVNPVEAAALSRSPNQAAPHVPAAPRGRGPVPVTIPPTSLPRHGYRSGQQVPLLPPVLSAASPASGPPWAAAPASPMGGGGGGGGGGTGPQATNLVLLPGMVTGDISLQLYFDAPSTGWTQGVVSLYAASAQATLLHSAAFPFAQVGVCRSPANFCFTLDNKDSWGLTAGTSYVVTVTLVAADGTKQVSPPSGASAPRTLPVPPPAPPEQLRGSPGFGSSGRTGAQPVLRGFGVNTATGAFTQHAVDASMSSSYTIDVSAARTYSSLDTTAGLMGVGWSFSYEARVFAKPNVPGAEVFRAEDGTESTYTQQPGGSYLPPPGIQSQLSSVNGAGWLVVTPDQRRLSFDAGGRLLSSLDVRGKGVTLTYGSSGQLAAVTDAGGRQLSVTLQSGLLARIALPDGRTVYYTYSGGRLHSVRDPDGDVTTYDYDASGRLAKITDPLGHVQLKIAYDPTSGRVSTQTDLFGHVTTFTFDPTQQLSTATDPDGVTYRDSYLGNVLQASQNNNGDATLYRYDSALNAQVLADPLGHQYQMAFDAHGNVTSAALLGANPATEPGNVGLTQTATYDSSNNLLSATDGRNKSNSFTYNQFDQVITATDGENNTTRYDYFPDTGLLRTITDPLGHVTTYGYDAAGDRTSQTDATGAVTTFGYDATGRVVSKTDPRGNVPGADPTAFTMTSTYDGENRVRRQDDPLRHFRLWAYDNAGRMTTYTDANTSATTYVYDDANQLVTRIDPDQRTTGYTYTNGGRLASLKDGAGDVTTYGYDAQGRLKTVTSPRGNATGADPTRFTTTFQYDFNGNRSVESHPFPDGTTGATLIAYDSLNQAMRITDPLGRTVTATYDASGNRIAATDALGDTYTWAYDGNGRVVGATDPRGNVPGANPAAFTVTSRYDAAGRLVQRQTPLGETTTFTYDAVGRLLTRVAPRGNVTGADPTQFSTTFAYDVAGNRTSVTDPLHDTTSTTYDANDNVTSRTDANGHSTIYTYDPGNRLVTIQGPDATASNQDTVNGYDHAGNLITRTNPLGFSTRFTYDGAQRLTSLTDELGRARQYNYDPDGNLVSILTARATSSADPSVRAANTVTQEYDILDQLTARHLGSGPSYGFGYDAAGELTGLTDVTGQQVRGYDAAGRLTTVTQGTSRFAYTYDAAGNLTSRALPDGSAQSLTYDADGRPSSLTVPAGGSSYTYDPDGNVVDSSLPGGSDQQRAYDNADRLASLSDLGPGKQVLSSYRVTRDPVGNPVRQDTTQAGVSHSDAFSYDAANWLTAMCYGVTTCSGATRTLSFTYDLAGNRLTSSLSGSGAFTQRYSYDAANELTSTSGGPAGSVSYSYDADGNQVRAGGTSLTYALDDQVSSVDDGKQKTVFTQDASGDRVAADTTPDQGGATAHTAYQWDVNNPLPMLVAEVPGAGPARSYTYQPTGSPLSLQAGSTVFLYAPDPFGSTADLTDLAGTVQQQLTMTDPFGGFAQTTPGGSGTPDPRLVFQGQYNDPLSGAYHLRARDYSPGTGSFRSVDPRLQPLESPAESPYGYAHNNPLTGGDPSGLMDAGDCATLICFQELSASSNAATGGGAPPAPAPEPPASPAAGAGGPGDDEPVDLGVGNPPPGQEPWYRIWSARHNTAVAMVTTWLQENLTGYMIDVEFQVQGGAANGRGNIGWADIVAWGSTNVFVWEVKHKGGAAEAAGPAQLDRYIRQITAQLRANGDYRTVEPGPPIPASGLGPWPNLGNPTEWIFAQPGMSAGIVTYTWAKGKPPLPIPVWVPGRQPAGASARNRPDWVRTRPLWLPRAVNPGGAAAAGGGVGAWALINLLLRSGAGVGCAAATVESGPGAIAAGAACFAFA